MKTLRKLIALTIVLAFTCILVQCKKDNEKKPTCNLITVTTSPNGTTLHLTFNADGKLIRSESTNSVLTYEYSAGSVTIVTFNSGTFHSKTIATLNSDGLATNVRKEDDTTGTIWTNTVYEYNGQELSKSTVTTSTVGQPVVSTYTWANQNLVNSNVDGGSQSFGYYTNKPRQTGDYFLLVQQLQGYETFRNKNLLKTIDAVTLNYQFGTDGRINSLSAIAGATETFITYEYLCE
jgi:hypothetical protein